MSAATFPMHVVPIVNVRRGDSEIILCDGTKDAYAIRDARPPLAGGREAEAVLAAVVGVYQLGEEGRTPIPPIRSASSRALRVPDRHRDRSPSGAVTGSMAAGLAAGSSATKACVA